MEAYLKFIGLLKSAGQVFDGLPFMKIFLPIISVAGIIALIVFGLMGIFNKKTILLVRWFEGQVFKGGLWIEGVGGVVMGIIYLIFGIVALLILVPFSLVLLGII